MACIPKQWTKGNWKDQYAIAATSKRKRNKKTSDISYMNTDDKKNPTDANLCSENDLSGMHDILFMEDDNTDYKEDDVGYCDIFSLKNSIKPTDAKLWSENYLSGGMHDILFMKDDNVDYKEDDVGYCDIFNWKNSIKPIDANICAENDLSGMHDILFVEDDNADYEEDDVGYCDIFHLRIQYYLHEIKKK